MRLYIEWNVYHEMLNRPVQERVLSRMETWLAGAGQARRRD